MKKNVICACIAALIFLSCNNKNNAHEFSLSGEVKNLSDQKVYLEHVYFEDRTPEILDSGEVKGGKFILSAQSADEGLFRVSFKNDSDIAFLVINDKEKLQLNADKNNLSLKTISINSPANSSLKDFIATAIADLSWLRQRGREIQSYGNPAQEDNSSDSLYNAMSKEYDERESRYKKYVLGFIDTCSNATAASFASGYASVFEPEKRKQSITALTKRFPNSSSAKAVAVKYEKEELRKKEQEAAKRQRELENKSIPKPGDIAPEITMPDTEGKMFSLSSLRGKYVLVDFWASWCGPCRAENPNVVAAYNKYSNKNFTILGVSLDKKKEAWLDAVKADGLTWKHISDLKQWESEAQKLYQFEGIPYNVLIDPQGKILAVSLRGEELDEKLAEVLK